MGLVVERICVLWCLVIVAIFMGFGQAGAKRCGGYLKVINWGWRYKSQERGSFHREGRFSHGCSNHSDLEMEAERLTKTLSYLNLNISRTKNGRNKL